MQNYNAMKNGLEQVLIGFDTLSGDSVGNSGDTVHSVRKGLASELRRLATLVESDGAFTVYPSAREASEKVFL